MAKKNKEAQYYVSKINTKVINYNVYVMNAKEKLMYSIILLCAGGAVGLIYYGGLFKDEAGNSTFATTVSNIVVFTVVGLLAIKFFMKNLCESLRKKRLVKLRQQFVNFASALTNSLASGMNMNDSLNAVLKDMRSQYSEDAYIVVETEEIINGINNNIPVETMLEDFGERSGVPDIKNFATVFATCYRTGGNIKSIVRRTTDIISEKIMISSEIETTLTSNRMQSSIMNIMPIGIVLLLRLMSPAFAEAYASVIGVVGLTISGVLTIVAFKMSQKIMNIKG